MAASAYFPVWKSLRVFRITWLYFLISGDNFCVNCFRPISTGNPMKNPIFHHFSKTVSAILFQFKLYVPSPLSKSIGAAANRKVRD